MQRIAPALHTAAAFLEALRQSSQDKKQTDLNDNASTTCKGNADIKEKYERMPCCRKEAE
jgi:hypothetical protein